jgi:hypothetical protein
MNFPLRLGFRTSSLTLGRRESLYDPGKPPKRNVLGELDDMDG